MKIPRACYSSYSTSVQLSHALTLEAVNSSMFVVSWTEVPGASAYKIIVYDGSISKYVNPHTNLLQDSDTTNTGSETSVLVKGLRSGVPYQAKVSALVGGSWRNTSPLSAAFKLGTTKRSHEKECAICLDKPAEIAMDPCGHLCACEHCAASLASCPICRVNISKRLRVF